MKAGKLLTAFALFMGTLPLAAQNVQVPEEKSEKAQFHPHWTLSVQGGVAHTRGEAEFSDLLSPAAAISGGYRFSPVVGVRVGFSGWQAKGGWVVPATTYKYNYAQLNADVTFDMSSLLCGYNHRRAFNVYTFLGVGGNYAFNNDDAVSLASQGYDLRYLWDDKRFFAVGRAGLGVDLRLSERVLFNIEANANLLSDHFNSKRAGNPDWQFNLLAGFTFRLGKTHRTPAPAAVIPTPVQPTPVRKEEPTPEPVVEEVVSQQPAEVTAKMQRDVFFLINQSSVRPSEMSKVNELVKFLQEHPQAVVQLTGYADAATGNEVYNRNISMRRAKAVAALLKEKGVEENRIRVEYKGDTVQPYSSVEQNRVTICVAE